MAYDAAMAKRSIRKSDDANLDEALDESFPASDPVSLGHSDHVGGPASVKPKKEEEAHRKP